MHYMRCSRLRTGSYMAFLKALFPYDTQLQIQNINMSARNE